jgi:hypothetical protein
MPLPSQMTGARIGIAGYSTSPGIARMNADFSFQLFKKLTLQNFKADLS